MTGMLLWDTKEELSKAKNICRRLGLLEIARRIHVLYWYITDPVG